MNDAAAQSPAMSGYLHSFRRNVLCSERTYWLGTDSLQWRDGASEHRIPYADIVEVHEYKSKVRGAMAAHLPRRFDYVLRTRDGVKVVLNSTHRARVGAAEDRSSSCMALVGELNKRVAAANPDVRFFYRLRWSYKLDIAAHRALDWIGLLLWKLLRRIDLDRTANFLDWAMRRIGPRLRGSHTARANLTAAYRDKSAAEIEQILSAMWANMGRLAAEYVNLDRLLDAADPNTGRIVVTPGTLEKVARLREDGKPAVVFSAHLANYEIGGIWMERNALDMAILYRKPNFGPLTEQILRMRTGGMGRLISAGPDSVWEIRKALKEGLHVGMLVDQHFAQGVDVMFFGRPCKVNPMPARFAQLFDCPVHGFRTIRLPGNRIQIELTDAVSMPRDDRGRINVESAMQKITSIIEGWIDEHPEQWLWQQRRWR